MTPPPSDKPISNKIVSMALDSNLPEVDFDLAAALEFINQNPDRLMQREIEEFEKIPVPKDSAHTIRYSVLLGIAIEREGRAPKQLG